MNKKNYMPIAVIIASILLLVGAVIIFCLAPGSSLGGFSKVMWLIIAVLLILLASALFVYGLLMREKDPNFFLYDRRKERNIEPEELTSEKVKDQMSFYISFLAKDEKTLWDGEIILEEDKFGTNNIYKPLVIYKMLCDIADDGSDESLLLFANATRKTLAVICDSLIQNDDSQMAKKLVHLWDAYSGDLTQIRDFITGNRKYLAGRMLTYVKANLEAFY